MTSHPMQPVLDAFKPLFDAAEYTRKRKKINDRIYTLANKLFMERDGATEGAWMQAYEDAEGMIEEQEFSVAREYHDDRGDN